MLIVLTLVFNDRRVIIFRRAARFGWFQCSPCGPIEKLTWRRLSHYNPFPESRRF